MVIGTLSVLATSANAFDWSSSYLESNDFTLSSPSSEYEKYDEHKYLDQGVVTADEWHKRYEQESDPGLRRMYQYYFEKEMENLRKKYIK